MRIERVGSCDYWIAESLDDLCGWEVIFEEPWKESVYRLHCRRLLDTDSMEFRVIYCSTSILQGNSACNNA